MAEVVHFDGGVYAHLQHDVLRRTALAVDDHGDVLLRHDAVLDAEDVSRLTEKGVIEIAPLAYMRGRTLSHAFIVLDEAQNTTPEQMMMFLTRLGEESRMVVTGDITQIDLPRAKPSGLLEVRHILRDIPGIDFHTFSGADVVRHPLVQQIIAAYDRYKNPMSGDNGTDEKR